MIVFHMSVRGLLVLDLLKAISHESDLIIGFSALIDTLVCGRAVLNTTRKYYWK